MTDDSVFRGGDSADCVFLEQRRDELAEAGSDWCVGEYRRYATCCASGADASACDPAARAAEECALGSGVPTESGVRGMRNCLEQCEASTACSTVPNVPDCTLYVCFANLGAALQSAQYEDERCADPRNALYQCARSSLLGCAFDAPCEAERTAFEQQCAAFPARGFSDLFDGCAAHCENKHLADPSVPTNECLGSVCWDRADGHRLEEKSLACHAAIALSAECFVRSSNGAVCDAEIAGVDEACGD